jgi:hypothetical protein
MPPAAPERAHRRGSYPHHVRYLSPEWLVAAGDALADSPGLRDAISDVSLTLEQTVTGGPEGTVRWHLVLDHGDARLVAGPADRSDLRFETDYRVARAIALGELAAPMAFIAGNLRVGGDLTLLTAHQRVLSAVDDVLVDVRKATTFAAAP